MINTDEWKRMETLGVTDLFEHYPETLRVAPSEITPHHYATWRQDGVLMLRIIYKDEKGYYHHPDQDGPFHDQYLEGEFPV